MRGKKSFRSYFYVFRMDNKVIFGIILILKDQGFSTDSINFDSCRRKPVLLAFKVLS